MRILAVVAIMGMVGAGAAKAGGFELTQGRDYRVVHRGTIASVSPVDRRELAIWGGNFTIEESLSGTFTTHTRTGSRPSDADEVELYDATDLGYDHASLVHVAEDDGHIKVTTPVLEETATPR